MNIVLDDKQREAYKEVVAEMSSYCPETIKKKFERANVQQAFVLDAARKLCSRTGKILAVGARWDTASESLRKLGYDVTEIDSLVNMSLEQFVARFPNEKFDAVISTSVLEHVQDDELFVAQICGVLKKGGYAILTCDFNDSYKPGGAKPGEDCRLYTKNDLTSRLNSVIAKCGCHMHGKVDYSGNLDFHYGIHVYAFATLVFRKDANQKAENIKFSSGGMMGDFIHSLYAVKNICEQKGAKADVCLSPGGDTWKYGIQKAYEDCRSIVLEQPYVASFNVGPAGPGAIDLGFWRGSVADTHARTGSYDKCWSQVLSETYGFPLPAKYKWMETGGQDQRTKGKVLIHKSMHRNNPAFPWSKMFANPKEDVLFITSNLDEWKTWTDGQWKIFKTDRIKMLFIPTISEMAVAISSCRLFVGNQSAPFALACAFDVPRLVELDYDPSKFYMGETRYSDNISWFLNDKTKSVSPHTAAQLGALGTNM